MAVTPTPREPLRWIFHGLTIWLEYEEYGNDLSRAIDYAVRRYGTEKIPVAHTTAIYGMTHLSEQQALDKLLSIKDNIMSSWPTVMDRPAGITQDIAQEGKPGQVCNIAWAELTFRTNYDHEKALDALYRHFDVPYTRNEPWTPHISLAYDNPEDSCLNIADTINYVSQNPTLMQPRRIKAISLWKYCR